MKPISINIATRTGREDSLQMTLRSLKEQTLKPQKINVYVNDYDVDRWIDGEVFFLNRPSGNLGAKGKFWFLRHWDGIYLTCDDDIYYPKNYVERMVSEVLKRPERVYCVHGTIYGPGKKKFYDYEKSWICHFQSGLKKNTRVMVGGTGTMAFDSSTVGPELFDSIEDNRMNDIYVAKYLKQKEIPVVAISRSSNWLSENPGSQDEKSIWKSVIKNDRKQTEILNLYW